MLIHIPPYTGIVTPFGQHVLGITEIPLVIQLHHKPRFVFVKGESFSHHICTLNRIEACAAAEGFRETTPQASLTFDAEDLRHLWKKEGVGWLVFMHKPVFDCPNPPPSNESHYLSKQPHLARASLGFHGGTFLRGAYYMGDPDSVQPRCGGFVYEV